MAGDKSVRISRYDIRKPSCKKSHTSTPITRGRYSIKETIGGKVTTQEHLIYCAECPKPAIADHFKLRVIDGNIADDKREGVLG